MPEINLIDFFTYFDGQNNPQQMEAVQLLQSSMNKELLKNTSAWVVKYREEPPKPQWPITKAQMAQTMLCSEADLPDSLMDDFARCVEECGMDTKTMVYFLGQCGHESAGLRYPLEIASGAAYEGRCSDLGNCKPGDGIKYAGTGYIQVTGYAHHKRFSDFIGDPKVVEIGKTYTCEKYPWSISGFWWRENNMNAMCAARPEFTNHQIDEIGARVNGKMRPNGADDRIGYTDRAYKAVIGV